MQIKILKDLVLHVGGPGSVDVVNYLYDKKNVNEFLIAKKLKMTINHARNLLYKLAEEGIVTSNRKKDKKNGGWYTYFWTLDVTKALAVIRKKIAAEIEAFEQQISSKQTKQFYFCPNGDMEINEENALGYNFTCPECGEVFKVKDNADEIKQTESKIVEIAKKLALIDEELGRLGVEEGKAKNRRAKYEVRKKKAKSKKLREEKKKAAEKEKKAADRKKGKKKKTK